MQLFEISVHEFESRFGKDKIRKDKSVLWLVNNKMVVVVYAAGDIETFGETELSDDEEYRLLAAISPRFKKEMDEVPPAKEIEDYKAESIKSTLLSQLLIVVPVALIIVAAIVLFSKLV